ncbi:MAG: IS110 family transposase [Sciscionella sp.]
MSVSPDKSVLALDIGAATHAWCGQAHGRKDSGMIENQPQTLRTFLTGWMDRNGPLRLLVEATGIYYLDVALIAHELGAEVMVINPRAAHHFAKALGQRNKTDRLDAAMLLECLKRMPFQRWEPPRKALLELRCYGRYLVQLTAQGTAAKNRLHALCSTQASPASLRADLRRFIVSLDTRIERIRADALALIHADTDLAKRFEALDSIIGVAETSAISLLSELVVLPPSLSARACVCHAGLDPRLFESGTSVHKAPRISKHGNAYLRRALFHPALAAGNHDPRAKAFKERLVGRGKKKMQANVAIMRKMLTAAWAIVRDPQPYDSARLYADLGSP